jgi:uncharacterized protein YjbJ (UPF0337 family)
MANTILRLDKPWSEVKERIKETNIELTDEDLDLQPGKENELLQRLQSKLHKSKEEIIKWIESLSANKAQAG